MRMHERLGARRMLARTFLLVASRSGFSHSGSIKRGYAGLSNSKSTQFTPMKHTFVIAALLLTSALAVLAWSTGAISDPHQMASSMPSRSLHPRVRPVPSPPPSPRVRPVIQPASRFVRSVHINPHAAPVPKKPSAAVLSRLENQARKARQHKPKHGTKASSTQKKVGTARSTTPKKVSKSPTTTLASRSDPLATPCCLGEPAWMKKGLDRPDRLIIPTLHVNAAVEPIALTSVADKETPRSWWDAAWWDRGPLPGAPGVAWMYGHLDSTTGTALFWYLHTLVPGNRITVTYFHHKSVTFEVVYKRYYWDADVPLSYFGSRSRNHILVIMTCAGTFYPELGTTTGWSYSPDRYRSFRAYRVASGLRQRVEDRTDSVTRCSANQARRNHLRRAPQPRLVAEARSCSARNH